MKELRQQIIAIGKKLYQKEFITATEGNISLRVDDKHILTTCSGVCKGELQEEDIVLIDCDGNQVADSKPPSTEIKMHLEAYRQRRDIQAIIHAHPPYTISLSLAGVELTKPFLPESVILLGSVPTAKYGRPSTEQVAESLHPYIKETDVLILARHGSLTMGSNLTEAFRKLELLEHSSKIVWLAHQLNCEIQPLESDEVEALFRLREEVYGLQFPVRPFN